MDWQTVPIFTTFMHLFDSIITFFRKIFHSKTSHKDELILAADDEEEQIIWAIIKPDYLGVKDADQKDWLTPANRRLNNFCWIKAKPAIKLISNYTSHAVRGLRIKIKTTSEKFKLNIEAKNLFDWIGLNCFPILFRYFSSNASFIWFKFSSHQTKPITLVLFIYYWRIKIKSKSESN